MSEMLKKNKLSKYVEVLKENGVFKSSSIKTENMDIEIECLTYDTREVTANALFVCKGAHFKDEYAHVAMNSGAVCYVSEREIEGAGDYILVSNVRRAMVYLAECFYDHATEKVTSIGLTGTKGKSTTAFYLKAIMDSYFEDIGKKDTAIISSISTYDGVTNEESHLTTPEAIPLHKHFNNAYESGISHLIMEVSSQALKYDRVLNVNFDIACFTNIGLDHISSTEHKDFNDYFSSKLKIFDSCKLACINTDSDHIDEIMDYAKGKCEIITYGTSEKDMIYCSNIEKRGNATYFTVRTPEFKEELYITMPGLFNVSNALAAIAMAYALKIPKKYVIESLKTARVNGRMLIYTSKDNKIIGIVDYAHNKMSFDAIFKSTKLEYPDRKIITVFGCPGNKAPMRRHDLGLSAGQNSDYLVITEDDPEEEDFADICNEIVKHIGNCKHYIIENRGEAIKKAFFGCTDQPRIILMLGKGEEANIRRGTEIIECPSDSDYAIRYLKEYDKEN